MKRLMFLLSFLFVIYSASFAGNMTFFENGNIEYKKGDFAKALEYYDKAGRDVSNWKIYFNMGNCYFKADNFLKAKIYYLRALRLKPFEKSIRKNLEITNSKLGLKWKTDDEGFIEKVFLKIESFLSLNIISFFLLVSIIVFNFFLIRILLSGKNRFLLYAIFFSMISMIFFGGYHSYRVRKANTHDIGVVRTDKSLLLSGPGEGNTTLYNVVKGIRLKILENSGEWVYVSVSDTIAGWIKKSDMEII
jgi:tetratricopeptide (TPR) repeat protein